MNKLVIFGGVLIVLAAVISGAANWFKSQPAEAQQYKSNFEVIDTYNGCAVVRYAPPNAANYHYFLDCQK